MMATAFLTMTSGIVISLFFKKKKWRLKAHRTLGQITGYTALTALILAGVMVQIAGGYHFISLHAISGGITGIFLIVTPLIGYNLTKFKNIKRMKKVHRTLGFVTFFLMIVTILLGTSYVWGIPF